MRELRNAVIAAVVMTVVFGLAYPLAMTGAAQVLWPHKADGDPTLIAKDYSKDDSLFQARPSVTGYAADATFFNNQGPNQKALARPAQGLPARLPEARAAVHARPDRRAGAAGRGHHVRIRRRPADLGRQRADPGQPRRRSGAASRSPRVISLVDDATSRPLLGLGGPKSVNVVKLNDALEAL